MREAAASPTVLSGLGRTFVRMATTAATRKSIPANHFLAVRHPVDADRLSEELRAAMPAEMSLNRLDGELGRLGIPRWTTFIFSVNDVHHADVEHMVENLLSTLGLGEAFVAPELA
jgi:hypothetical protein